MMSNQIATAIWERDGVTSLGSAVDTQLRLWPCDVCRDDKQVWLNWIGYAVMQAGDDAIINPPQVRCPWCARRILFDYHSHTHTFVQLSGEPEIYCSKCPERRPAQGANVQWSGGL